MEVEIREEKALNDFFGQEIKVPSCPFPQKNLEKWMNFGFEPHFLPRIRLSSKENFPGWQKKPQVIFYQKIEQGKISKESLELGGEWILIESRSKPEKIVPWVYSSGFLPRTMELIGFKSQDYFKKWSKQQYKNDFLLPILKEYRWQSRYACSFKDIEKFKPRIAEMLGLKKEQLRLPYFIEYNFLANNFYSNWQETSTWEWLEDKFDEHSHLCSGSNSFQLVAWDKDDYWSTILGFRLLIRL